MQRNVYTFDSLSEFLRAADIPMPYNAVNNSAWDSTDGTNEWAGATRDGAVELARLGWPEGRANMVEAMAQARPEINLAPAFTMDVAGSYPIAALAAAGDPCPMVHPDPLESRVKPIIRLAVNVWASCSYTSQEFTAYGAAVLSYIDAVEAGGFRVELTMLCHCKVDSGPTGFYSARVVIKHAEEPLDIDRATFCLTHVAMLRRIFFAHMQVAPGAAGYMRYCGNPLNPEPGDVEDGVIVVPGINTISPGSAHLSTPRSCAKHISGTMEDILSGAGVKLPELAFGGGSQ